MGIMAAFAVIFFAAGWAGADEPGPSDLGRIPFLLDGNPTCVQRGYDIGFKVDPVEAGDDDSYAVDAFGHEVTVTTDDDIYFDWESNFGIDAVIVKGGNAAHLYVYDPPAEVMADGHLHSPINPSEGPAAISHIEFCYDYEVDVSKTAETSFTRTFEWTIDKSVDPAAWDLFTGDSGTSLYTVAVNKDAGTDSGWAVNGTITIVNNTPIAASVSGVADVVSPAIGVTPDCGVAFPHALASGASLQCTYSTALPNGTDRTNTATVTTSGAVGGNTATAPVTFGDPTTVVNGSVTVTDTNTAFGGPHQVSDDKTWTYEHTFTCDEDEGTHNNTATIVETNQSDSALVTVNCHSLQVRKNANTALTRTWTWTIDKWADQTDLLLSEGQSFTVNYEVEVSATPTDGDHVVSGVIGVRNPAPIDAELTAVSDIVSPDISGDVDCDVTFPYILVAGGTLNCTYSADLTDASDRTNTATATLQNYDYAFNEDVPPVIDGTPSGTTNFTGTANVDLDDAVVTEVDECVDVTDTNAVTDANPTGLLGEVCAGDADKIFNYSLTFGTGSDADVVLVCGDNSHPNTATFFSNDTDATDSDTWTVDATVACGTGCNLTPGYWKTHSDRGPAPYDDAWALLANDEDTAFFGSGKTYYQALWTAPGGNAYYILAHAYIAAQLNQLNGASIPTNVLTAFNSATTLFNGYTPAAVAALRGNSPVRAQFISLAGILDAYNNGITGPGHCSEQI